MFQFPINPVIGQIFTAAPGTQYQWNGTGWTPYSTVHLGALTLTGPLFLPDGTIPAPALSWANEPTSGWIRTGLNTFNYIVGGTTILGVTKTLFATTTAMNVAGLLTATGFLAQLDFNNIPATGNTCGLEKQGLISTGTGAGGYGSIFLRSRDTVNAVVNTLAWQANPGLPHGFYDFSALNGGGKLQIYGGGYNTGAAGVTLQALSGGTSVAGIDMVLLGGPKAEMRFTVNRVGTFNLAGDMTLGMGNVNQAQLKIKGGWGPNLSNLNTVIDAGMVVQAPTQLPGICLYDQTNAQACIIVESSNTLLFGWPGSPGPISGYAVQISQNGTVSGGAYSNVSDRAIKENIRPVSDALRDVLRLCGVRYHNKMMCCEDIGLVAQDVESIYPELVGEVRGPDVDGVPAVPVKTLNYIGLIAPLIEAVRELDARIKTLETA